MGYLNKLNSIYMRLYIRTCKLLCENILLRTLNFEYCFYRYAVKYNEQLILTLEEDEFSCKQRLAYKLEQVHNIMQGDSQ